MGLGLRQPAIVGNKPNSALDRLFRTGSGLEMPEKADSRSPCHFRLPADASILSERQTILASLPAGTTSAKPARKCMFSPNQLFFTRMAITTCVSSPAVMLAGVGALFARTLRSNGHTCG
jgi:hypothetical protein